MVKQIKNFFGLFFNSTPMSTEEIQKKAGRYSPLQHMNPEAKALYLMIREDESIRRERWILLFTIIACLLSLIAIFK